MSTSISFQRIYYKQAIFSTKICLLNWEQILIESIQKYCTEYNNKGDLLKKILFALGSLLDSEYSYEYCLQSTHQGRRISSAL